MDIIINNDRLANGVMIAVRELMKNNDASHDFNHIKRVAALAWHISSKYQPPEGQPPLRKQVILLAVLLHDVADRKYLTPGVDPSTAVRDILLGLDAPAALADDVQAICGGVSYSTEVKDPSKVQALVARYPELAVVQDADRLDSMGAFGIGRVFTYGGAKQPKRGLQGSFQHIFDKLIKLPEMCKTEEGRKMATERLNELLTFAGWWRKAEAIPGWGQTDGLASEGQDH